MGARIGLCTLRPLSLLHAIPGIAFVILLAAFVAWLEFLPPKALPNHGTASAQPRLVFDNVTIVNPGVHRERRRRIELSGNRIMRITDSSTGVSQRVEDRERGFSGLYALPGLIDMHVHLPPAIGLSQAELFGFLFLAHGVTTVREMGSLDGSSLEQRRSRARTHDTLCLFTF